MGSSVGSHIFLTYGWRAGAGFSMALYGFQLCVLLLRGPHCKRDTWVGYEGGWEARKSVVERGKRLEAEMRLECSSPEKIDQQADSIEKGEGDLSTSCNVEKGLEMAGK